MNNLRLLLLGLSAALLLVGCAAPVTQDWPPVEETGPSAEGYPADLPPPLGEAPAEEAPSTAPQPPAVNPAVISLGNQARGQYNARNYQGAIATAERGLRIDRRASELYLVLAQSYLQLAMPQQAEQFVQQGLRFAQSGSSVAESLMRVRDILTGGDF